MEIVVEKFKFTGMSLPVKPQVVGECLTEIYENNNHRLTPELIVKSARSESSPLHPCFEWNDKKAAYEHRLSQAREIIRHVKVVRQTGEDTAVEVRAFLNIKEDRKGNLTNNFFQKQNSYYVKVDEVMNDNFMRQYTVDTALRELNSWMDKYKAIKELADFFELVESEIKKRKK